MVNTALITLASFHSRKIRMMTASATLMPTCTLRRSPSRVASGRLAMSRMSTQKLVVRAVRALSALEYAAAIRPSRNMTPTTAGR